MIRQGFDLVLPGNVRGMRAVGMLLGVLLLLGALIPQSAFGVEGESSGGSVVAGDTTPEDALDTSKVPPDSSKNPGAAAPIVVPDPPQASDPDTPDTPDTPVDPDVPGDPSEPGEPSEPADPVVPEYVEEFVKIDNVWHYFDASGTDTGVIAVKPGWVEHNNAWYWFKNADSFAENQWVRVAGSWYYFGEKGRMLVGHQAIENKRYYLSSSGAMLEGPGWNTVDSTWYYPDGSGVLAADTWRYIGGAWYWFDEMGRMATGWLEIDQHWYYLNGSGAMQTGWLQRGGTWYYLYGSGAMAEGWAKVGGAWYYLSPDGGAMHTGWLQLEDKADKTDTTWYYLDGSGALQTGWVKVGGSWYYTNGSGAMADGWTSIGGSWYYLTPESGAMRTGWLQFEDAWYYLRSSGAMAVGWETAGNHWYYFNGSGIMQTGWMKVQGSWYFLNKSGAMRTNAWLEDKGNYYYVTRSGRMDSKADTGLYNMINSIIDNKIGRGSGDLERAFNYVASFDYREGSKFPGGDWSAGFAQEMYWEGSGNCYRYAALFCWLARGLGYNADTVSGWVPSYAGGQAPHAWVEIRRGGTYVCDPCLSHDYPGRNWYMTTYAQAPTWYGFW